MIRSITSLEFLRCWLRIAVSAAVIGVFLTSSAQAHRVILFSWVDGDKVMTKSRFSNQRPVRGGEIQVYNTAGDLLLSGRTDDQGGFSFPVPGREALRLVLIASPGHQAKWDISEVELASAASAGEHGEPAVVPVAAESGLPGGCRSGEIKAVVEPLLDRKLAPVMQYIAESREQSVSLRDIIGGIGYIIGLVGLATYIRFRPS